MSAQTIDDAELERLIGEELPSLIELRHDLHAHPQLGFEETYASAAVQEELRKIDIPFQHGLGKTGVVGWIVPEGADRASGAIGLRADMDALPILEETGLPYASQHEGKMHACGHDGHTTVLVGASRVLAKLKNRLPRPVKLLFQPAEEGYGGAVNMIEEGALDESTGGIGVSMLFGLHGDPRNEVGHFSTRPGAYLAATDAIAINIVGRGGHAAMPHFTADPIVAASQVVTALQSVVARNVDPIQSAVVTIGAIHGGDAFNVIPAEVTMVGTIRTFDTDTRDLVHRRIKEIVEQTAAGMGCTGELKLTGLHYPAVLNDAAAASYAIAVARNTLGEANVDGDAPPIMGGEDFSFYGAAVPSCFAFIGVRPPRQATYPGLHTSKFDFTDDAIRVGVKLMCGFALGLK
ncbi:MAG: amidohydrolase [Planctomycetota bacterium]|nr:amidohydrolase [Planctomycetota bacterium]MDA1141712.1 amidohydrolase [Planctomycetota bacterium]